MVMRDFSLDTELVAAVLRDYSDTDEGPRSLLDALETQMAKLFDKGSVSDVYAEDVGEVAYQASCYRNVVFGS